MFCLCRTRSTSKNIQRRTCNHDDHQRAWIDVYTLIDIERAIKTGYKILEYKEIRRYHSGSEKVFKDFILNIVRRKIECLGFLLNCDSQQLKEEYVKELEEKCGIVTNIREIKKDPAGRYLNKIMANSVWGKWAQNPSLQSEIITCDTSRFYHNSLRTGRVERVSLISEKLSQVEMKCDRSIDGENRENTKSMSGLGGKNTIVGTFITAAARDLMYERFLSKLNPDQLLNT